MTGIDSDSGKNHALVNVLVHVLVYVLHVLNLAGWGQAGGSPGPVGVLLADAA